MKNFHVFEVDHRKSLCGQVERKSPTSEKEYSETKLLERVIKIPENKRRQYCGQCIGTFFADDDY